MRITSIAAAVLLAGLPALTFAQGYVGASIGQVRVNLDCTGTDTCDKSDTAFKVFGGYMFMPYVGVEGAYYDQGKLRQTATDQTLGRVTADWKGDGWGLFAVGAVPLGNFSLFGKLGAVSSKIKVDATSSVYGQASDSERHTNVGWGLGGDYAFTKNLRGRIEFEQIKVKFQEEKRNANLLTAGIVFMF